MGANPSNSSLQSSIPHALKPVSPPASLPASIPVSVPASHSVSHAVVSKKPVAETTSKDPPKLFRTSSQNRLHTSNAGRQSKPKPKKMSFNSAQNQSLSQIPEELIAATKALQPQSKGLKRQTVIVQNSSKGISLRLLYSSQTYFLFSSNNLVNLKLLFQ